MWLIKLGFHNYFTLKRYRLLTTSNFIGSASTVHKSSKMFYIALFSVIQAMIDAYWCSVFRFWYNISVLL